jgi:hypothetical protein
MSRKFLKRKTGAEWAELTHQRTLVTGSRLPARCLYGGSAPLSVTFSADAWQDLARMEIDHTRAADARAHDDHLRMLLGHDTDD